MWPNCLSLDLGHDSLVVALTGQYGIPGNEEFTSAVDLAQTQFKCCGISSNINYDTSLWQLQGYAQKDLIVPLTCCELENYPEEREAYLDPKPLNLTLCQSLPRTEYSKGRHLKSCDGELKLWYEWHYLWFLAMLAVVALVNFFVLLTIICSCTNLKRKRRDNIDQHMAEFERKVNDRRAIVAAASSSISTRSSPIPAEDGRESLAREFNNSKLRRNNLSTFQSSTTRDRIDFQGGSKAYLV